MTSDAQARIESEHARSGAWFTVATVDRACFREMASAERIVDRQIEGVGFVISEWLTRGNAACKLVRNTLGITVRESRGNGVRRALRPVDRSVAWMWQSVSPSASRQGRIRHIRSLTDHARTDARSCLAAPRIDAADP